MIPSNAFIVSADGNKRECGGIKWTDKGHDDNKPKEKLNKEVYNSDICKASKDIDHMKIKGAIKDWTEFKTSDVYNTSTDEQKKCLKEHFDSPDNHRKNLADYELSYCGFDKN